MQTAKSSLASVPGLRFERGAASSKTRKSRARATRRGTAQVVGAFALARLFSIAVIRFAWLVFPIPSVESERMAALA